MSKVSVVGVNRFEDPKVPSLLYVIEDQKQCCANPQKDYLFAVAPGCPLVAAFEEGESYAINARVEEKSADHGEKQVFASTLCFGCHRICGCRQPLDNLDTYLNL